MFEIAHLLYLCKGDPHYVGSLYVEETPAPPPAPPAPLGSLLLRFGALGSEDVKPVMTDVAAASAIIVPIR